MTDNAITLAATTDAEVLDVSALAIFTKAVASIRESLPPELAAKASEVERLLDTALTSWVENIERHAPDSLPAADESLRALAQTIGDSESVNVRDALNNVHDHLYRFSIRHGGMGIAVANCPSAADALVLGTTEHNLRAATSRVRELRQDLDNVAGAA